MKITKKKVISIVATIVLISITIYNVDFDDVLNKFQHFLLQWIIIAFAFYFASSFIRALRWYIMIEAEGVKLSKLFPMSCAHIMYNYLLPFRTGELLYIYLLKTTQRVSGDKGVASLVVARTADLVAIILFCSVSFIIFFSEFPTETASTILIYIILAAAIVFAIFLFFKIFIFGEKGWDWLLKIVNKFKLSKLSISKYILDKSNDIRSNIKEYKRRKKLPQVLIVTLISWCCIYGMYYSILNGMDIELVIWAIVLGSTLTQITTILPIHGIAGLGTVHAGWILGFMAVGIGSETAFASAFVFHILHLSFNVILGLYGVIFLKFQSKGEKDR